MHTEKEISSNSSIFGAGAFGGGGKQAVTQLIQFNNTQLVDDAIEPKSQARITFSLHPNPAHATNNITYQ